jgi:methylmalonyl-CoA decarboxylase
MSLILSEKREGLGIITLNNIEKRNCFSRAMIEELLDVLCDFEKSNIWVVILRAPAGTKVWSAGHDILELPAPGKDPLPYAGPFEVMLHAIQDYPGPIIAMVEGTVWGGGCDVVLCCDLAIGCDTTTFAMTPAKMGIPYNPSGLTHFISKIGLGKVKEMFYTADPITSDEAFHNGILNHVVTAEKLEEETLLHAHAILKNAPKAVCVLKKQFSLLTKGNSINAETAEHIQALRREVYTSNDYVEAIAAFKEKRKPCFKGN